MPSLAGSRIPAAAAPGQRESLFGSRLLSSEVDSDLRLDLDRFAIEVIRLISPLANGLKSRVCELCRPAQHFWIDDAPFLIDGSFDLHRSLGMGCQRAPRILRFYAFDQQSLQYSL